MCIITENEAPPPNVPLSGPLHLLSKSLRYSKPMTLAIDSMHDQIFYNTIIKVFDGEVLRLYHIRHYLLQTLMTWHFS